MAIELKIFIDSESGAHYNNQVVYYLRKNEKSKQKFLNVFTICGIKYNMENSEG